MKETWISYLVNIFDIKDFVWFILGFLVPYVISAIKKRVRKSGIRRRIKKEEVNFEDIGIISLAHGDPFYEIGNGKEEILLGPPNDDFFFSMPADIKERILQIKPEFDNTKWTKSQDFFQDQEETFLNRVAKSVNISVQQFQEVFERKKREVAEVFLKKVEDSEPYFNGEVYGIQRMDVSREGENERATLKIKSYKSDYYTHRVMAAIFQELYVTNPTLAPTKLSEEYNKLKYFLTAIGMDVLIILEDEESIVFAKRSGNLINMTQDKWHVSMNEAISITDLTFDQSKISLENCIIRGVNEELGVKLGGEGGYKFSIYYGDAFLLQNPLETGISAFVFIEGLSFGDLKIAYAAAKDRELETIGLTKVKYNNRELKKFVNKEDLTETCQYMIKMLMARHMKNVI